MQENIMLMNLIDSDNEYCLECLPPEKIFVDNNSPNKYFEVRLKSKNDFSKLKQKQFQWCLINITNDPYTKDDTIFTNLGYSAIKIQIPFANIEIKEDVIIISTKNFTSGCYKIVTPLRRVKDIDWNEEHTLEPNIGFMMRINVRQLNYIQYKPIGERFNFIYSLDIKEDSLYKSYKKTMNLYSMMYPCEVKGTETFDNFDNIRLYYLREFNK